MKVLVVSAHPDDMEIACAGTLRRLQYQGAEIVSVVTVHPSAEANPRRSLAIVEQELADSYRASEFELRMLDTDLHPNGRPNLVANNITMTQLADLIEPCDIAIIPNPQDSHQDHRATYDLAYPLVKNTAKEIWLMHSYPYMLTHPTNSANLFYNISGDPWYFKQHLMSCYSSYIDDDYIERVRLVNQYTGLRANCELAEAFTIIKKNV
jgi:LmbE family N-acetylglucosaminyl deacetylase